MKWQNLLDLVSDEPMFTSSISMAGDVSPADIRLQLARWVKGGKLIRLRRGIYMLANPYRKVPPHPFLLANRLKKASYVSLQSALSHYGMIPESVPVITSVTTGRPETLTTPAGTFLFQHIRNSLFNGYRQVEVGPNQPAFLASPEKSLLDLIYLTPQADSPDFLRELRLQNLEQLNLESLIHMAEAAGSSKLVRAAKRIARSAREEDYEEL
jgi:predicted transcriptional regulator of viral defense system